MRSNHNYLQLTTALAVSCSLILSACQMSEQQTVVKYAGGGKGASEANKPANGRAVLTPEMEKMKLKITTLEAYKTHIAPIFAKLTESSGVSWDGTAQLKTWIVGPLDLNHLPVKTLSGFKQEDTEISISQQSVYEIWIDENAVADYSDREKTALILQEYLTGIYLLRGFKNLELCNLAMAADPNNEDCRQRAKEADVTLAADEMKSPKRIEQARLKAKYKYRHTPLKEEDYEKIVAVKNYIENQGPKLEYKALMKKMGENDFDLRIFAIKLKE